MLNEYDVIVAGGGTAGTIAAIQSARAGAETLLVEKNAMLGGTMTVGGVNFPAQFFAWGEQIIGGIGFDLVRGALSETGQQIPSAGSAGLQDRPMHLDIDIPVFAALCDEAACEAGADILFHSMLASAVFIGGRWELSICTKSGLKEVKAGVLVDATGDASAVSLAGFNLISSGTVQPATLQILCSGYDPKTLDYGKIKSACDKAVRNGKLKSTDISYDGAGPEKFLRRFGVNANHIFAPDGETSEGRTEIEIEARRAALRLHRFFRSQPGLENFRIERISAEAGIRETVRIEGKKTITVEDYESGKLYSDAVCYACYPVDEHLNFGRGVNCRMLKRNTFPTIPRGAMLPAGSRFIITAGRPVSSDREANSAIRVECPCMAMGQAAGAMAALSAKTGIDAEELPVEKIHALLREHGAVVPGDCGAAP